MKNVAFFLSVILSNALSAQELNKIQVFTKKNNGIELIAKDSLFSCQFQFRMQNRLSYESKSTEDFTPETFELRTRRLRLSLRGFVYNPKWTYRVQLSFSRGDMDWDDSKPSTVNTSVNVVRDAIINYHFTKDFTMTFGQTKLPGNRQRVVSSGDLQFAERSIVNATFTVDRDFGVFLNYDKPYFKLKGAITSGEGRNSVKSDKGLSYTGRVELLPLGKFTGKNDYQEGDLEREQKPKISIGATYNYNSRAKRNGGQLGDDLFSSVNIQNLHLDLLFKYKGIALYNEYCLRVGDKPVTTNGESVSYVYNGYGNLTQLSYIFKNNYEIAARYCFVNPYSSLFNNQNFPTLNVNRQDQIHLGLTKYLSGHRLKVQTNLTYNMRKDLNSGNQTGKIGAIFQIEMGI